MATPPTKDRILDAAEELFADHGFDGASLRALTTQAGTNLAAVHYHFGSKEALFRAVIERRVRGINAERLERLAALNGSPPLESILEAFLAPAMGLLAGPNACSPAFLRLMGRLQSSSGEHAELLMDVFQDVRAAFFPAFAAALPELDESTLIWRIHFVIGLMCSVLADPHRFQAASGGRCDPNDREGTLRQLIAFSAAGMRASAAVVEAKAVKP